ncbi:uncharacterized protein LOC124297718 [Neodiprion virginianus]|uniref:uncharacterized protein LOC124297718 n=1 Tax=Neodiprion virginianus TaxID=2961670 RepID=UPI001EE702C5|nr:uncharacterized protein LOC124297718 [Neodiprion virginianus]
MENNNLLAAQQALLAVIRNFTQFVINTPNDQWSLGQVQVRFEMLNAYWADFQGNHLALIEAGANAADGYNGDAIYAEIENLYIESQSKLYNLRDQLTATSSRTPVAPGEITLCSQHSRSNNSRLAPMNIPTFSGRREDWEAFRDAFFAIVHEDDQLSDVQRLFYLRNHVEGEAKQALTNENSSDLPHLCDSLERHRKQLEALGRPVSHWDDWFISIAANRLDPETRGKWQEELERLDTATIDHRTRMPTYTTLINFLNSRCRTLKSMEGPKSTLKPSARHPPGPSFEPRKVAYPVKYPNARTFVTKGSESCGYCQSDHYTGHCEGLLALQPSARRDLVAKAGLCFNCLRSNHTARFCPSRLACSVCGALHHTSLHEEQKRAGPPVSAPIPIKRSKESGNSTNDLKSTTPPSTNM